MRNKRRAPEMVLDLNDQQAERWREGDHTVWDEDRAGRPLSPRAVRRRESGTSDLAPRRSRRGRSR